MPPPGPNGTGLARGVVREAARWTRYHRLSPAKAARMPDLDRKLGLEQEFFLVEPDGRVSDAADAVLARCETLQKDAGLSGERFQPEWVRNMLEVCTPPCGSCEELAGEYLATVRVAMEAAHAEGLRLYPLSSYPLHVIAKMRDSPNVRTQLRTVGFERFLNAGRCTGTHLHVEVAGGAIDPVTGVSLSADEKAKAELVNAFNAATALDPVMIALGRSCPFYEGHSTGLAYHTTRYRGSDVYGWDGVYTNLPDVGGLRPYAESPEGLLADQFERHYSWLVTMDRAGVERRDYLDNVGGLLKSSWNPVRLNAHGTVEMRNIDSNLPSVVLGVVQLADAVLRRVREDGLCVQPTDVGEVAAGGGELRVPDMDRLAGPLLFGAVTEGLNDAAVQSYVHSVQEFAGRPRGPAWLADLLPEVGEFVTTERRLLREFYPDGERLTRERGLELVRTACDDLEREVEELSAKAS